MLLKNTLPQIKFENKINPKSFFDIVRIEDLFNRALDHNVEENHLVKFYIIFYVYEGKGVHAIDFHDYKYSPGTVLIIRKDQVHKFFKNKSIKGYLLVFTEEFIISHLNQMEASKTMQLFNDSLSNPVITFNTDEEFNDFTVLVKHMESEYQLKDDFSIGITRSVLHIVITKLFRVKAKKGQFIDKKKYMARFIEFQKLVEAECFESKKVSYYAKKLGVSAKTLNTISNSIVNTTAKAFIDERVMMQVKRLIITTDHSIKEIAFLAGFSDPSNFYKYFKKFAHISPEVFRKQH